MTHARWGGCSGRWVDGRGRQRPSPAGWLVQNNLQAAHVMRGGGAPAGGSSAGPAGCGGGALQGARLRFQRPRRHRRATRPQRTGEQARRRARRGRRWGGGPWGGVYSRAQGAPLSTFPPPACGGGSPTVGACASAPARRAGAGRARRWALAGSSVGVAPGDGGGVWLGAAGGGPSRSPCDAQPPTDGG